MLRHTHTEGYRVGTDVRIRTNVVDPKCSVTSVAAFLRERRSMFSRLVYGYTPCRAPLHVDSNDVQTQILGLKHRVARKTPMSDKVDHKIIRKFKKFVKRWCKKNLTPITEKPDFYDWIQNTPYTQDRRAELTEEYLRYLGEAPPRRVRRKIASFIKTESYPEFKHARWINSRSDAFKAWSGPWFKKIEEAVFAKHWFIKHVPVPDRANLINSLKRDGATYWATDYTSFEAHFHPALMKACEGVLYSYMLTNFPEVSRILCATIFGENHGRTRRGVSFKLNGRRMSGDMCTSLGNGFTNLMIWAFLAEENGTTWDGYVEGDDGIFAIYSGKAPTPAEYERLGFTIKISPGSDPSTMSFCGIIAADGQNIRDPGEFLNTFGWTSNFSNGKDSTMLSLLRAKALSAAYEMPHCPIIRAIADRALVLTRGAVPRFVNDGYHKLPEGKIPLQQTTAATRDCFDQLFGVTPSMQIAIEKKIATGCDLAFLDEIIIPNQDVNLFANRFVLSGASG